MEEVLVYSQYRLYFLSFFLNYIVLAEVHVFAKQWTLHS